MLSCLQGERSYCCLNAMACWTNWRTGRPLNRAGLNTLLRMVSLAGAANAGCVVFITLKEDASVWPVVSTMNCTSTRPVMPALANTGGEGGCGREVTLAGSSHLGFQDN